jgi:hypothetical protein
MAGSRTNALVTFGVGGFVVSNKPSSPGGIHVMLIGLKAPLKAGQTFPVPLTFEKAGTIMATMVVEKADAMSDTMPGMHGKMPGMP